MDFIFSSKQQRFYFYPYLFSNKYLRLELDANDTSKSTAKSSVISF
jgi:hypothetical protein